MAASLYFPEKRAVETRTVFELWVLVHLTSRSMFFFTCNLFLGKPSSSALFGLLTKKCCFKFYLMRQKHGWTIYSPPSGLPPINEMKWKIPLATEMQCNNAEVIFLLQACHACLIHRWVTYSPRIIMSFIWMNCTVYTVMEGHGNRTDNQNNYQNHNRKFKQGLLFSRLFKNKNNVCDTVCRRNL